MDRDLRTVVRVDPVEGSAAIIADTSVGRDLPFVKVLAIAVEATGALVVVDAELGAVVRVDPQTGDRKIVPGCPAIDAQRNCLGTLIGQGPPFLIPLAIAIGADGDLWVGDAQRQAVMRVDPQTGDRAIVSIGAE